MYNKYCGQRSQTRMWGFSSAGRAPALHAGGQEFESPNLHHLKQLEQLKSEPTGSFLMLSIHLSFEEIMADVVIRHLKLKCLTHKMINFKFEPF